MKLTAEQQEELNYDLNDACSNGDLEQVKELHKQGADVTSVLGTASYYGDLEIVKYLVENGADVNMDDDLPLRQASQLDVVKYLVEQGADVNAVDDFNNSVIKEASESGELEIVKYLHQNGADLDKAIEYANPKIKEELMNYKTSIEEKALLQNDLKEVQSEKQKTKNTMRI